MAKSKNMIEMGDIYKRFDELKKENPNAFNINCKNRNSLFLIFSPHGGGIEPGISEICYWFDKVNFSYYIFEGNGKNCRKLHITSTNFDEPTLMSFLNCHQYSVSFHGMQNNAIEGVDCDIYLGGLNDQLIECSNLILRKSGFLVETNKSRFMQNLAAQEKSNVTNRCISSQGMQIEISENLRASFFVDDYKFKKGRKTVTENLDKFCNLINESINEFLSKFVCVT